MKTWLFILLLLPYGLKSQPGYSRLMLESIEIILYYYDSTSNTRMGFMDSKGQIVIEPKYIACSDFKNGIANVIRPDGTYGIIDKSGREIWYPGYEKVYFKGDLGIAGKGGKWGFINKKGKVVIPLQFASAMPFNEGYAPVQVGRTWEYIDKKGRILQRNKVRFEGKPIYRDNIVFVEADTIRGKEVLRRGLMDKNGQVLIPATCENIISLSSGGLCWIVKNRKNGIVNISGKEIVPFEFDELNWDAESHLISVKKNGLWGCWNDKGEEVIPLTYNKVYFFSEGLAAVEKEGKIGFIDEKNNVVIPFQFAPFWTYQFKEGLSPFKSDTGKHGFINNKGEIVILPKYDMALAFTNGLGYVKLGDHAGFVDKNGIEVVPLDFEDVWGISEGLIRFSVSQK